MEAPNMQNYTHYYITNQMPHVPPVSQFNNYPVNNFAKKQGNQRKWKNKNKNSNNYHNQRYLSPANTGNLHPGPVNNYYYEENYQYKGYPDRNVLVNYQNVVPPMYSNKNMYHQPMQYSNGMNNYCNVPYYSMMYYPLYMQHGYSNMANSSQYGQLPPVTNYEKMKNENLQLNATNKGCARYKNNSEQEEKFHAGQGSFKNTNKVTYFNSDLALLAKKKYSTNPLLSPTESNDDFIDKV